MSIYIDVNLALVTIDHDDPVGTVRQPKMRSVELFRLKIASNQQKSISICCSLKRFVRNNTRSFS